MQTNVLEYLENGPCKLHPAKVAISHDDRQISYSELFSSSRLWASTILRLTQKSKGPIAVFLPRSIDAVICDLAIVYSGNFYTNIDIKSPKERLRNLLINVAPIGIFTSKEHVENLKEVVDSETEIFLIEDFWSFTSTQVVDAETLASVRASHIDTDPICLVNTSGSTGVPKSVVISHRSVIDYVDWWTETFDFSSDDTFGSMTPFHFDHFTADYFVAQKSSAKIEIIPDQLHAFPQSLVDFLETKEVSFIFWVPTVMVNIANLGVLDSRNLPRLRRVFFAGEVFPTKQLNIWRRSLPNTEFVNLYGPTEITVDCTYFVLDREFDDADPIPIGLPCRNSDVMILTEDDKLAEPGQIGELCVRGSSLALGYYNNPEQTSKAFVQNPLNSSYPEIIYRTGDLVHTNELGEIMFDGRKDFQIKHQGYRIELAEIENAVQALPEILNACVLYNKEKKAIILVYETQEEIDSKKLRISLQSRLPKYMLPTVFVELDEMPRNPNGKIDRQLLSVQHASGQ